MNFDHENENFLEAIGVTHERIEEIQEMVEDVLKNSRKRSQIMEGVYNLDLNELEYIIAGQMIHEIQAMLAMKQGIGGILGQMFGSEFPTEHDCEECGACNKDEELSEEEQKKAEKMIKDALKDQEDK